MSGAGCTSAKDSFEVINYSIITFGCNPVRLEFQKRAAWGWRRGVAECTLYTCLLCSLWMQRGLKKKVITTCALFYSLNLNSQQVTVLWLRDYDPLHAYRCWESFPELKIRRELCCCHSTHNTDGAAVPHTYVSSLWQFSSPTWLYSFSGEKKTGTNITKR